jgi:hypothetical protein
MSLATLLPLAVLTMPAARAKVEIKMNTEQLALSIIIAPLLAIAYCLAMVMGII